ncbi:MAG: hypothetical protein ACKOWF_13750 [Chloroflexota bacterium]
MNTMLDRMKRPARVAIVAAAVAAGLSAPLAIGASAGPGMPGCPSTDEIVAGFNKGLGYLVEDGSVSRAEARDARAQFTTWAADQDGLGCAIRDGMMESGGDLLRFVGMTPAEMKDAYYAGDSLAEMARSNGHSRGELISFLEDMVDYGLDAFVAAGAFDDDIRDAIDARAEEHIGWAVDYEKGDPVPDHHDSN